MADAANPTDWACDDPDAPGRPSMLSVDIVKRHLQKNESLWNKAKRLKRADIWTAAGFGKTTEFDNWTVEELKALGNAFGDKVKMEYTGGKIYGICCSCG